MLLQRLFAEPRIAGDARARLLVPVLTGKTDLSSAGYPFLEAAAFARFRDEIPHLLREGQRSWEALDRVQLAVDAWPEESLEPSERESFGRACRVVRNMLRTATITAPPDLWLLRIVLAAFHELGLHKPLLLGAVLEPDVVHSLNPRELKANLSFLHARGYVERVKGEDSRRRGYRMSEQSGVRAVWEAVTALPVPPGIPTEIWRQALMAPSLEAEVASQLLSLAGKDELASAELAVPGWIASWSEIDLGWRVLPLVLGLQASGAGERILDANAITADAFPSRDPRLLQAVGTLLRAAGSVSPGSDNAWPLTKLGRRLLQRGPGPFGIIQTYHPYMSRLVDTLKEGRQQVWVRRGANVFASQRANRESFRKAHDALDRFCVEQSFSYEVFIEHAMGRGEAIRQRYARSGEETLRYFGADLEDDAIDAAMTERTSAVQLPPQLFLIRNADISRPEVVVNGVRRAGSRTEDAVMMVGNGFHEVREQTFEKMVAIFRGYQEAGIVLLFTEASALSVEDLRLTGWNTYHAGFKYVHNKSGQGLRPAYPLPEGIGSALPASWTECALAAGYVRLDRYSVRSRTIYPHATPGRINPAISVNHFFIPGGLARRLKVSDTA